MKLDLTTEQKQALYCGSDWKLPPDVAERIDDARAAYELAAIQEFGLSVSEYQYSHRSTGTVVLSCHDAHAVSKLRELRERFADAGGIDHNGFGRTGDEVFRLAEGWTSGGDVLGQVRLNPDTVLAMIGHEVYVGNEELRWAVVVKFDPRPDVMPITVEETEALRAKVALLRKSPGRPLVEQPTPSALAVRAWRAKQKGK